MHPKECIVDWHDGGCGKESGKSFACVHFWSSQNMMGEAGKSRRECCDRKEPKHL